MPLSRFGRRHKHTFGRKKEEWDGDFRKPPKPDSYYVSERGICRWCGEKIIESGIHNTRKTWHEKCATQYMIMVRLENTYGYEIEVSVKVVVNNVLEEVGT